MKVTVDDAGNISPEGAAMLLGSITDLVKDYNNPEWADAPKDLLVYTCVSRLGLRHRNHPTHVAILDPVGRKFLGLQASILRPSMTR